MTPAATLAGPVRPRTRPVSTARSRPVSLPVLLLSAMVLTSALPGTALAQYKWKDARGQIHVSDRPPPREVPDKDILQRPRAQRSTEAAAAPSAVAAPASAASAALAAARPGVDAELEARRRKAEQEAAARARAEEQRQAALRADNCERARQQLATLGSGQRMIRITPSGERVVVDDAMRAQDMERARAAIADSCR